MKFISAHSTLRFLTILYVVLLYGRFIGALIFGDAGWLFALLNTFALYLYCPLIVLVGATIFFRMRFLLIAMSAGIVLFVAQYGPLFLPRQDAIKVETSLRVMSFNIPFPVFGNDDERLARTILEQQADVVLMQEMTETGMHALEQRLADAYTYIAADRSNLPSEGKLILSKYPLNNGRVIKTGTVGRDAFAVDLLWQSCRVVLVDVHLTATAGVPSWQKTPEVVQITYQRRESEMQAILQVIAAETAPIIMTGDMNTTDQTHVYRLSVSQYQDAWQERGFGFGHTFPAPVFSLASLPLPISLPNFVRTQAMPSRVLRIDYIFHSAQLRADSVTVVEIGQSDHLAVIADLSLK